MRSLKCGLLNLNHLLRRCRKGLEKRLYQWSLFDFMNTDS